MPYANDPDDELVKAFMIALEGREFDEASDYLNDNFMFTGWTPRPLNKAEFLETIKGLKEGIPGLVFNLHNVADNANHQVTGSILVTGYQSSGFILPALGTPPIPQMAKSISLPGEDVEFELSQEKISRMHVQATPRGGIRGILEQLGVALPFAQ